MTSFPFTAVVGMDDLRLALVLNAVAPEIGGVLIRGEKGTAKSTAVRALAAVLPPVDVVPGCRFSCAPAAPDPACPDGPHLAGAGAERRPARLVELPVGATEDRLVGSLDISLALTSGVKAYEPGLLAAAHRGVLYVDEVNLLHDHLVDLLLDAAALGRSYVEREGVSVQHAARFLLVGTMNPEEGELRPQLLDRFGLTVSVAAPREPSLRAEVVRRRLAFDAAPEEFAARFAESEAALAADIAAARARMPGVILPDAALRQIASVCASFEVDGMRADIVIARTALAHAAWAGRAVVETEDVRVAARLALPHRRRRNPFDAPGLSDADEQQLDDALADADPDPDPDPDPGAGSPPDDPSPTAPSRDQQQPGVDPPPSPAVDHGGDAAVDHQEAADGEGAGATGGPAAGGQVAGTGATFRARRLEVPGVGAGAAGRRSRAVTDTGRVVRATDQPPVRRLHLTATLAAAAPHQVARGRSGPGLVLAASDLRGAVREGREGNLVLFVVDASGSMAARSRMSAVKGAVLSLLLDAYQRRDKVGLITFRGTSAEVVLPPTSSVDAAAARLASLPTGGRTPLAAGLARAAEVLRVERLRDPARRALVVLVTDGRHTSGPDPVQAAGLLRDVAGVVVDCESGPVRLGLAGSLAGALGAELMTIESLSAAPLVSIARERAA